ncbi:MAG TPA: OmpA family protein [Flavobacterium sp.]|uniref:OmpA family protein n=1 Tax=Flavobacterium sp. TaxID=239 RepID=UPI002B4B41EE|nr:OmpA family protein [Flavobacterium sp.]HLO73277.1 OmpA family protein [Flavobacterium sp.]
MKIAFSLLFFCYGFCVFAQEKFTVYFDSDKFDLTQKENKRLQEWITLNPNSKILTMEGFTDEVGSNGYNDTLSKKRVDFIYNLVQNKVAIRNDFKSRSFGETQQASKIKAENRKVIIYYLLEKDLSKENEILGIKEEITEEVIIPENATLEEKVKLARVGTKIVLKNINFYQNTFATVPESQGAMYDLLYVMQNNENLKIEIQGHICCIDKDYRNLSADRAKQIKRFLVYNGIPQHRIQTKGFGVSQPIYPIPEASEAQAAANRRVEIEILSK